MDITIAFLVLVDPEPGPTGRPFTPRPISTRQVTTQEGTTEGML